MNLKLQAPILEDCQQVRLWRNDVLETLRTPYPLTAEQQEDFYRKVICNRNSNHRYWSIYGELPPVECDDILGKQIFLPARLGLAGFCGLTFIEWENGQAEISLIINPELRGKGCGEEAVSLILDQAFNCLGLRLVYGECYLVPNNAKGFWKKFTKRYGEILKGKLWDGKYYGSMYFEILKDEYNARKQT